MQEGFLTEAILILVLTLANALFAASEIALVSARKGRLEALAAQGNRGATAALQLAEDPSRLLSTVQVGITVFSTFAAVFGGAGISRSLERTLLAIPAVAPYAVALAPAIVAVVISYVSLIIGELVPKRLALQNAEGVAALVAPLMRWLARFTGPIVTFLSFSTDLVLTLLGRRNVAETPVTEDDILALVSEGAEDGTVEADEQELIRNVFTLTDRTVRSLMTPRTQIVAADIELPFAEVLALITEHGYSRIPVYAESLDHILGILYVKDLLRASVNQQQVDILPLLRDPLHVLESQRAAAAFQVLKQRRSALAIVLDEYGQVAGVISVEDILEELVGDIADEYDDVDESFIRREDGSYLIDGLLPFAATHERLHLPSADELTRTHGFETMAGFILALLGRIPSAGDKIVWHSFSFEVVDMDGRRIDKILVTPPPSTIDQNVAILAASAAPIEHRRSPQRH